MSWPLHWISGEFFEVASTFSFSRFSSNFHEWKSLQMQFTKLRIRLRNTSLQKHIIKITIQETNIVHKNLHDCYIEFRGNFLTSRLCLVSVGFLGFPRVKIVAGRSRAERARSSSAGAVQPVVSRGSRRRRFSVQRFTIDQRNALSPRPRTTLRGHPTADFRGRTGNEEKRAGTIRKIYERREYALVSVVDSSERVYNPLDHWREWSTSGAEADLGDPRTDPRRELSLLLRSWAT